MQLFFTAIDANCVSCPITLMVDPTLSVTQLIGAGKFVDVNPDILLMRPLRPCQKPYTSNCRIIDLHRDATWIDAENFMKSSGFRAATLHELLAFCLAYASQYPGYQFAALGSPVEVQGRMYVPYIHQRALGTNLRLKPRDSLFNNGFSFLAIDLS